MDARAILTDLDNNLDPAVLADDEHCYVLPDVTRIALLRLLENISPDDLAGRGMTEREVTALGRLCVVLR